MTFLASEVLTPAATTLQDTLTVRWTTAEMLDYLNAGIRALITARPDANPKKASFVPVAGARQALPAETVAFIDLIGNTSGTQRAVTKVSIDTLSAVARDWQSGTPSAVAVNFMYDPRDPFTFYLYPPANGLGSVDLLYSVFPAVLTTVSSVVNMPNMWANPLTNYVIARAYDKDAEYGGNAQLAASYMSRFTSEIGTQLQSSSAVIPKQ